MTTATKDTLLAVLKRKELNDLANDLETGKTIFEEMMARTEGQWKEFFGLNGIDIYNHLHASFRSLLSHALPPLGPRELSYSVSKTRVESAYKIQINTKIGSFGILDEFTRDKLSPSASSLLWTEAELGRLKPWSGENSIQRLVQNALMDCLKLTQFEAKVNIHTETTFSISRIMAKHQDRVDVTSLVNDTKSIAGVCEVKLPGFNLDSLFQIVDYMVDLRNSFNVRFVFGVLTTYEKWRILWFEDTNIAATETKRAEFDELCKAGTANDYSIGSSKVTVYTSRVYDYSEVNLVEVLASLMYKISRTPIASPQQFIEPHKKFIHTTKDSFTYESLPQSIKAFSYQMPDVRCQNFYILQYYHRGGDGRIALCCSSSGNLCVIKFLLYRDNEEDALKKEADLWNLLWETQCRVVYLNGRFALLMPFCFHIRMIGQKPTFCGLQSWNRLGASADTKINDFEVDQFEKVDHQKFKAYQDDPLIAAKEALTCMLKHKVRHDDLKWAHVALLPSLSKSSDNIDLIPVLLDLTRTTQVSDTTDLIEKLTSKIIDQ
ncbi:hypothetical protein MIR68_001952 [Amoeboaphelidium protococcarum]|nr:hypothetical protein MIR68_001952 [Amoeboaphelidium protococcarum]